jgi:NTE family protein
VVNGGGEKGVLELGTAPNPGIGLALGGGMARGFAHIGVLKCLDRHGIKPAILAGTSIGSVVGAAYLVGKLQVLEDWALSLNRLKILSYLDIRVRSAGMIGGSRLNNLLFEHFKETMMEDLPIPFVTVAADLKTGHEVWIRRGELMKAMTASFALPGVFPAGRAQRAFAGRWRAGEPGSCRSVPGARRAHDDRCRFARGYYR